MQILFSSIIWKSNSIDEHKLIANFDFYLAIQMNGYRLK